MLVYTYIYTYYIVVDRRSIIDIVYIYKKRGGERNGWGRKENARIIKKKIEFFV